MRDNQTSSSISGWVSVAASLSVAAAVVGFCWEDVQCASSAVQKKISRNIKKSFGVAASSFRSGLSGVAALEDDDHRNTNDTPPPYQKVKAKRIKLHATPQARGLSKPMNGRSNSTSAATTRRSTRILSHKPGQGIGQLQRNVTKKRRIAPVLKEAVPAISESLNTFLSSGAQAQADRASESSIEAENKMQLNKELDSCDESSTFSTDERDCDIGSNNLEPIQLFSSKRNNIEKIDEDIVSYFEAASSEKPFSKVAPPQSSLREAISNQCESNEKTMTSKPPKSEKLENTKLTGIESLNNTSELGSAVMSKSNNDKSLIDDESSPSMEYSASDFDCSDEDTAQREIAAVEPGRWIALPGEEDDGTTTVWLARILAYKSKNVITVRYLRKVHTASEIADTQAYYDEINDYLKKSKNECFVFYETRTYKKVFREGYVNIISTPFVILRSSEVNVHMTWGEAMKSQNCLVSFDLSHIRMANINKILDFVTNSKQ